MNLTSLLLVSALAAPAASEPPPSWAFVAAEQSAPALVMGSARDGAPPAFFWRWEAKNDPNVAKDADAFANIDECKVKDGGRLVLACASNGGAVGVDVPSRRARWYLKVRGGTAGPHSLDLLPDGRVALACSTGIDALYLFDVSKAPFDPPRQTCREAMALPGAHGVVWDAARASLFVLGYTNIFELAYAPEKLAVSVKRTWDYSAPARDAWGHDLVPDGARGYYFTNHAGVWHFDPDRTDPKDAVTPALDVPNVKSISRDAAKGDLLLIPTEMWWADRLLVMTGGVQRVVGPFPGARFYKARWMEEECKAESVK